MDGVTEMTGKSSEPRLKDGGIRGLPELDEELALASVARFKALADPTRLRILAMLASTPAGMCVCDLNEGFDLEQPTISHHLKVLRKAGLVSSERRGTWVYCWLDPGAESWVRETLASLSG
jgi:ArsR family transcriptional regulator